MKFNAKYNRYVSKDGLIYKLKNSVLELCKTFDVHGYLTCSVKDGKQLVHRIVFETFNSDIPDGYEIDHINYIRDDNRLSNLQLLTHIENLRRRRNITGMFSRLFVEHFHTTQQESPKLYARECMYYVRHNNTCRWQMT